MTVLTGTRTATRPPAPTHERAWDRRPWLRELVLVAALYATYEVARALSRDELSEAVGTGRRLFDWERARHLDPEPALNHWLSAVTPLAVVAAFFYATLHYLVTPAVLVWMYRRHPDHYRTARTTLAITCLLALVGFATLPTAPPRLLPGAGIHDTLAGVQAWGWWGGDGSVPRGLGGATNQFAALPSLHVGWAVWSGFLLARYATRAVVRWLGVVYPLLTTVVVLATGNHYLVDALAGAAVVALAAVLAPAVQQLVGVTPAARRWSAGSRSSTPAPARRSP